MFTQTAWHTPTLSREAYYSLESKLQALKLKTLSMAMSSAHLQQRRIWCDDIDRALRELSATGIDFPADTTEQSAAVSLDIFLYLVKRLHSLRVLVFHWAVKLARTDNSSKENTPLILSPENIELAWSTVANQHLILRQVLLPDDVIG
jgi:hypothetical protein